MSWRTVVISHTAKLDYQIGYLVVRGQETIKIHLSEIGILVVESTAVSMTAYLLSELVKKKIKVIFCDEKRNPSSELISYYGSHDTSVKIRRQMEWSREEKATLWTEIVSEKIRKQAELLEQYGKTEAELLYQYINEIELGDVTNREGHAAKVYFNALFGKDFTRTEECPINAALNYGYALILSCFNREIVSNGYITQIGKHEMLQVLNQEVILERKKECVINAIKIYTKSVFDALNDKDISLIRFYRNEL